jgi:hypothetical protein
MELYAAVQPFVLTKEAYAMLYGEDDPEELAIMQLKDKELAQQINSVMNDLYLLDGDLAQPREGEGLSEEVGTAEALHELRQIAAALQDKTPDDYYEGRVPAGFLYNHLINHSDTDGYYLPVDFPQAFFLEEISIGSATALLQELDSLEIVLASQYPGEVALALSTPEEDDRAPIEGPVGVWHSLRRLCRSSLELDLPIHFG